MTPHGLTLLVVLLVAYCQATLVPPDSSPNILYQPIYTRRDPRKYGFGVGNAFKMCRYKSFGINGARIPLCRTFQYNYSRPAYKLGYMDKKTVDAFCKVFQGLLQPSTQASASRGPPQHDNDMCCPTVQRLSKAPFRQMDVYGNYQDIIHLSSLDFYQYYHTGICLESKEENYCHGKCIQATSTVYVAVFDFTSPAGFNFAPFTLPTYCSCRNIGNNPRRTFNKTMSSDQARKENQTTQDGVSRVTEQVLDASKQSIDRKGEPSPQKTSPDKKTTI